MSQNYDKSFIQLISKGLILAFCILLLVFLDIYNYLCNINTYYIIIL